MPRFSIIDAYGWVIGSIIAENEKTASDCFKGLTAIDTTNETRNPYYGSQYVDGKWVFAPLAPIEGENNA
jgi:hypothetical protein